MVEVDFGRTTEDYARHRAGFPSAFFDRLARLGIESRNRLVLDLGSGTGAIGRELARRGANVVAVDPAREMLVKGAELDRPARIRTRRVQARAESLGLRDGCLEGVVAGQCWWWFDEDRALAEVRRVLAPRGFLVLASYDWVPVRGSIVAATEELILRHNSDWRLGGGDGLHAEWVRSLDSFGFEDIESFSIDTTEPYDHAGWRGRIRASAGVGASLSPTGVAAFDRELAALLADRFPVEPLAVDHRVFAVAGRRAGG